MYKNGGQGPDCGRSQKHGCIQQRPAPRRRSCGTMPAGVMSLLPQGDRSTPSVGSAAVPHVACRDPSAWESFPPAVSDAGIDDAGTSITGWDCASWGEVGTAIRHEIINIQVVKRIKPVRCWWVSKPTQTATRPPPDHHPHTPCHRPSANQGAKAPYRPPKPRAERMVRSESAPQRHGAGGPRGNECGGRLTTTHPSPSPPSALRFEAHRSR